MSKNRGKLHEVQALLLRRTDYGESDLVLTVFTDSLGKVSVLGRGARKSQKRFGGALEPFHELRLKLTAPLNGDLFRLEEAQIGIVRVALVENLTAMTTAGRALSWVRRALPPQSIEPEVYYATSAFLDQLNNNPPKNSLGGDARLCRFGLRLLSLLGWALELQRCIRCGRPCPPGVPATIDPEGGGLVCRLCGGARIRVSSGLRAQMVAAALGNDEELDDTNATHVLNIVEKTLQHHGILDS